jgi:hypothetical protein
MKTNWEYLVIEEANPPALQERLCDAGLDGWEAVGLAYVGEGRLLALLKRPTDLRAVTG